jgi:hypothetical protein
METTKCTSNSSLKAASLLFSLSMSCIDQTLLNASRKLLNFRLVLLSLTSLSSNRSFRRSFCNSSATSAHPLQISSMARRSAGRYPEVPSLGIERLTRSVSSVRRLLSFAHSICCGAAPSSDLYILIACEVRLKPN